MKLEKYLSKGKIQTLKGLGFLDAILKYGEPKTYKSLDGVTEAVEPEKIDFSIPENVKCPGWDYFEIENGNGGCYDKVSFDNAVEQFNQAKTYTADEIIENCRKRIGELEESYKDLEDEHEAREGWHKDNLQSMRDTLNDREEIYNQNYQN